MVRKLSAWVVLGAIAAATGCSMCSHPYDYCGPVSNGGCDGLQCGGPRAGTIRAMGGPVMEPHPAMPPEVMESYSQSAGAGAGAVVYEPSSPLDQIISPLGSTMRPTPARSRQVPADIRQYLPANERDGAEILSVTDETLEEMQARTGGIATTEAPTTTAAPTTSQGTGTWTARRPSATRR